MQMQRAKKQSDAYKIGLGVVALVGIAIACLVGWGLLVLAIKGLIVLTQYCWNLL